MLGAHGGAESRGFALDDARVFTGGCEDHLADRDVELSADSE